MITKLELETVPNPQPYKVTWVNSVSIDVKGRCFIPIQFATYSNKIWYILGWPWLYDLDVTIYGCSNFCLLVFEGKKVKIAPLRPASLPEIKQTDASSSKKSFTLISPDIINKKIAKGCTIVVLIDREITDDS